VNNPQVFTEQPELSDFRPITGGGTMYSPAFKYADEMDEQPAGLVYITDGECNDFPRQAPDYPVVWILTQRCEFKPPFGTVGFMA
jgi:predicted metal-dependent peptidase